MGIRIEIRGEIRIEIETNQIQKHFKESAFINNM